MSQLRTLNLSRSRALQEAIEEAEKLYRDTRRRVSTDNIKLASSPRGDVVASATRSVPEFAARYGDQFGRRNARSSRPAVGIVLVAALMAVGAAAGVAVAGASAF
ncbi:MAG: hypothetical protein IPN47_23655 [Gemmatimonadetes bacterium]|nr:hypothetical protein [Gemmatimonadota bacterium]